MFGVRRDLMRVAGGNCTLATIRNWQPTPLAARRQCLVHTIPRSAAYAISTAQGYHPIVWSNSSSGIGSASTLALCNHRSCPASALRFAVWSHSSLGIASNIDSGASSSCPIFISSSGERAGAIADALVGSSAYSSICRTIAGSVINPTRRTRCTRAQTPRRCAPATVPTNTALDVLSGTAWRKTRRPRSAAPSA